MRLKFWNYKSFEFLHAPANLFVPKQNGGFIFDSQLKIEYNMRQLSQEKIARMLSLWGIMKRCFTKVHNGRKSNGINNSDRCFWSLYEWESFESRPLHNPQ